MYWLYNGEYLIRKNNNGEFEAYSVNTNGSWSTEEYQRLKDFDTYVLDYKISSEKAKEIKNTIDLFTQRRAQNKKVYTYYIFNNHLVRAQVVNLADRDPNICALRSNCEFLNLKGGSWQKNYLLQAKFRHCVADYDGMADRYRNITATEAKSIEDSIANTNQNIL